MDAEQRMRLVAAADRCVAEAIVLLTKANDLLFDAGWFAGGDVPKLIATDNITEAKTTAQHARRIIVGANWATPGSKKS